MHLGGLGEIIQVDEEYQCKAAGGTVVGFVRVGTKAYDQYGRKYPGNVRCAMPQPVAPAAASAQITVSPTISTQVSPQVSPVLQQQFQPTGSPATAGTTQVSAPPITPSGVTSQSQLPPAPIPVAAQAPTYTAPAPMYAPPSIEQLAPAPVQYPTGGGGGTYYEPAQTNIEPTQPQEKPLFDWKIAAIIGLGLFGVMAISDRRKR